MDLAVLIQITIGAIFINNFVLAKFLGLCPFFGVSKKLSSAVGMGIAVIFVMTVATLSIGLLLLPAGAAAMDTDIAEFEPEGSEIAAAATVEACSAGIRSPRNPR